MESVSQIYTCNICNKNYKSKNSLGNHNRKFHPKNKQLSTKNLQKSTPNKLFSTNDQLLTHKYHCKYCNKGYNINQSKWKHEKTCKTKVNIEMDNTVASGIYFLKLITNNNIKTRKISFIK